MASSVVASVAGIVAAPPEVTWRALLTILPEVAGLDATMLGRLEEPRAFTVSIGQPPIGTAQVVVDPRRLEVSQKGQWWYQGVVMVTAHANGSTVTRTINNVASGWTGLLVPFVHRHDGGALQSQHAALLRAIGARLGCRAYVITDTSPTPGGQR